MKLFKRLIAMLLILALFAGDLGCNSFMALAAYADDAASEERKELTQIEQEESAEAEPAAEETEITEEDSAAEETENTEEDSAVEETENAEKESAAEEAEEEKIAAEEEPSRRSKAKTVNSTESAAEEPLVDVDFDFAARTVSLTEILKALRLELTEKSYKLHVDNKAVKLSAKKVKAGHTDEITLEPIKDFDRATLTITGSNEENSYAVVMSCLLASEENEAQEPTEPAIVKDEAAQETAAETVTADENTEKAASVDESAEKEGTAEAAAQEKAEVDIAIVDPESGDHLQPQAAVQVEIELLQDSIDDAEQLSLLHFGKELEELETDTTDSTVSFSASGFSVYVIVQGPQTPYEPSGNYLVNSVDKIEALGSEGFYLSHNRYYLTAGMCPGLRAMPTATV